MFTFPTVSSFPSGVNQSYFRLHTGIAGTSNKFRWIRNHLGIMPGEVKLTSVLGWNSERTWKVWSTVKLLSSKEPCLSIINTSGSLRVEKLKTYAYFKNICKYTRSHKNNHVLINTIRTCSWRTDNQFANPKIMKSIYWR